MKKLVLLSVLFLNCYATGEKDTQDILSTWQQFQKSDVYAKLAAAGSAINSFSYKYPSVIACALLLTCKKVPIYTKVFAGCWLIYQLVYSSSKSFPPGQK